MKKILLVILLVLLILPLYAKDDHFDIGFTFGHQMSKFKDGINILTGMQLGLTSNLEMGLWLESTLTPGFFKENSVGLEFSYGLLGKRSTKSFVAGSGINTLLNVGLIVDKMNELEQMNLTSAYISITPLTVGSPISGMRERLITVGVLYNWHKNEFRVLFSLFKQDFYVRNTWREYV